MIANGNQARQNDNFALSWETRRLANHHEANAARTGSGSAKKSARGVSEASCHRDGKASPSERL